MVVIKITGGLGNQMFQYLFGQHLSSKYNAEVRYDISSFEDQSDFLDERKCELLYFTFNLPIVNNSAFTDFKNRSSREKIFHFLRNFILNPTSTFLPISESFTEVSKLIPTVISNRYYAGYWQTDKFFLAAQKQQSEVFVLSDQHKNLQVNQHHLKNIQHANSVSLQVRRGDFLGANEWVCDLNYYQRAISYIKQHVSNPEFFIFSDDIAWCKKEFKFDAIMTFIEPNTELPFEDMQLMSSCKHNIIVNSTYGWWGAVLNQNKAKILISPKKWANTLNTGNFIKI